MIYDYEKREAEFVKLLTDKEEQVFVQLSKEQREYILKKADECKKFISKNPSTDEMLDKLTEMLINCFIVKKRYSIEQFMQTLDSWINDETGGYDISLSADPEKKFSLTQEQSIFLMKKLIELLKYKH
jgi:hypothetical protein